MRSRSKSIGNKWLAFLERLEKAYDLLATSRHGDTENLEKVYEVLTILPEARKLYSIDDFMADVHEPDLHGPYITTSKREVSFPASTSTKGSKGFCVVGMSGETKVYIGLRFSAVV